MQRGKGKSIQEEGTTCAKALSRGGTSVVGTQRSLRLEHCRSYWRGSQYMGGHKKDLDFFL